MPKGTSKVMFFGLKFARGPQAPARRAGVGKDAFFSRMHPIFGSQPICNLFVFLKKTNSIFHNFQKVLLPRTPRSLKANLLTTDSSYLRRFGRDLPVAYRSQNVLEMHPRHLRTPHDTSGHVRTHQDSSWTAHRRSGQSACPD